VWIERDFPLRRTIGFGETELEQLLARRERLPK
jgi:hypothetical protein